MVAPFEFSSRWFVPAPIDRVYDALHDIESYPRWWPEVRTVDPIDPDHAKVGIKAFLPYTLRFDMIREVADPTTGILRVKLAGDLDGYSQWDLRSLGTGTECLFEEVVELRRPLLRALAPIARPLLNANHTIMMRRGRQGLARYLRGA
jgi:hypothetical protein